MTITPEELAAYADGELSGARLSEVETAVAADPALAQQIAAHKALKAGLGAHFAPILDQPVPDRLTRIISGEKDSAEPEKVVSLADARGKRDAKLAIPRWGWAVGPALAASLALAVFMPRGGSEHDDFASPQLAIALDQQLVANQPASADTRILLSFRSKDGDLCRAYSGAKAGGVACREESGWRLHKVLQGSEGATGEYRQAGADNATLLAMVQDMAVGPALDSEQEAAAKPSGWQ